MGKNKHWPTISLEDADRLQEIEKEMREAGKSQLEIEEELGKLGHKYEKKYDREEAKLWARAKKAADEPIRLKLARVAVLLFGLLTLTCLVFIIIIETTSVMPNDTRTFWQREKMFILWSIVNIVLTFIMILRVKRMNEQYADELEAFEAKFSGIGNPVTPIVNKKFPNRNKKNTP